MWLNVQSLHGYRPPQHVVDQLPELLRPVGSMNDDPDALLPVGSRGVRDRGESVSELTEICRKQSGMPRENKEDEVDDLAREGRRCRSGAEQEEVWRNMLERFF